MVKYKKFLKIQDAQACIKKNYSPSFELKDHLR